MNNIPKIYDLIVVGAGAAGIIAAIVAARNTKKVLLLEKLPAIAAKLKATGGGKCNITNRLKDEDFITNFGKNGRFMQNALQHFNAQKLESFLSSLGVETHSLDGFRVFPTSHNSQTIIDALEKELLQLQVDIQTSSAVDSITKIGQYFSIKTQQFSYKANNVVIATGGLGFPTLGAQGDGYKFASALGHTITPLFPAMMPLKTKERWGEYCRAQTIAKVQIKVNLKKHKNLKAIGDLIFTKDGIRGPVVLDFAREITPLLEKYGEVPLLLNFTKGLNEDQITKHIHQVYLQNSNFSITQIISTLVPETVAIQLILQANIDPTLKLKKIHGKAKNKLIQLLAWTPLHIIGHDGFKTAMITRGGIKLKEIDPKTMQSKLISNLYFCGEIVDLDGPCGGYNLQWSFSSGYLAGKLQH